MFDLHGRIALVTGAASGIGAATARRFAQAGADVVLAYYEHDAHDVGAVCDDVVATGVRAHVVAVDVRSQASVTAMVESAIAAFGGIDIAVANAAIARHKPAAELDDESRFR